jgi:hypothetical protein
VRSDVVGATATFTFTGTQVAWISARCELCGIAHIILDGALVARVDTWKPLPRPPTSEAMWVSPVLPDGSHTITIRVSGERNPSSEGVVVAVDAFDVRSGGAPPAESTTPTRLEESAAALAPPGTWSEVTSAAAGTSLSGGRAVFTQVAGAKATLQFTGTGVRWLGVRCEVCGIANVFLDGALVATVDTFASARRADVMFETGLPAASHTLVIEVTGSANAASSDSIIVVDAFEIAM